MSTSTRIKWIICLDGTSNSERHIDKSLTNVSRIRRCISTEGNDKVRQVTSYHDGIGTGFKNPLNVVQQAVGDGIDMIILDAYNHLCQNLQVHEDRKVEDEIFLIGFSRGAYAARCLADLVTSKGLLLKGDRDEVHALYKEWAQGSSSGGEQTGQTDQTGQPKQPDQPTKPVETAESEDLRVCGPTVKSQEPEESVKPRRHRPKITACALWDTVSSIGMPIPRGMLRRRFAFINSRLPEKVEHVFQALSLHEHRYHFSPIVLLPSTTDPQATLEQSWFAGYHADIGGGCKKDALAHFALVWIMSRLERWLKFDVKNLHGNGSFPTTWIVGGPGGVKHQGDTYRLPVNDSMSLGFMAGGSKYRIPQMEFWNQRGPYTPESSERSNETIHETTRFLLHYGLVDSLKCVEAGPTKRAVGSWQWTLHTQIETWWERAFRPRSVSSNQNIIQEQALSKSENDTLWYWIHNDHSEFDDELHPAEEKCSKHSKVLIWLKDWLNEPERTAPSHKARQVV